MKKTALTLLALAGLVLPASALANVAWAAPVTRVPDTPPPHELPCWSQLDSLVDKLKSDEYRDHIGAHAMVMYGENGYAESCRPDGSGSFCSDGTRATFNSADEIIGTTTVTEYRSDKTTPLTFRLDIDGGVAKLKWRFKGKSYTGVVDSCTSGYWTATTSNGAIVVKLSNPDRDIAPT